MRLVDPTLSAIADKCAGSSNIDLDPWTLRRNPQSGSDRLRHHLEGPGSDEDHDDEDGDHHDHDEDDHLREMLMRIGDDGDPHVREILLGMMQESGGRRESRHSSGARGGFMSALWGRSDHQQADVSPGQQHGASASQSPSASHQETFDALITGLRELLLPFATSAVDLQGSEQLDRISEALLAAVIAESSSPACPSAYTASVTAALSNLKELALRGDLADRLDSPAGLRLVRALCLFMDAPGCASPVNVVCRHALFRSEFCSRDAAGASNVGFHALLQQILPFFEENHSEVIALFNLESAAASSSQALSSQSSGSFQIHLKPMPSDSGCRQYFGFTSITYAHDASSDLRSIAGKDQFKNQTLLTDFVPSQASQYPNSQS